uniref:Probable DNA polymerase n=1 Tax=Clavaria fumosa TaxID=264083 RepID=A0A7T3U4S3_9AGAR|nr:DNA polymerase [Clavaria fumosa]QPZ51102.1 DNA polymerase [Clavaria fumosa]
MKNKKNLDYLKIIEEKHVKKDRCLQIKMLNENFISKYDLYRSIYLTLLTSKIFIEFSSDKVFISTAYASSGKIFNLHDNIYLSMDLTLIDFLDKCKNSIEDLNKFNYLGENILYVTVKVWDMSNIKNSKIKLPNYLKTKIRLIRIKKGYVKIERSKRSYHTSNCKQNNFTHLSKVNINNLSLSKINIVTLDIETMCLNNSFTKSGKLKRLQTPILITCSYVDEMNNFQSFYTLINKNYLSNIEYASLDLWTRFFKKFFKIIKYDVVVFTHNLGDFDGYFLYKALLNLYNNKPECIIDKENKFIQISLQKDSQTILFKDSLRVFDVSLQDLCKNFNVEGKLHSYDPDYNKPSLFKNNDKLKTFINYGLKDSESLLKALIKAQNIYIKEYGVDIGSIWSTSTLSLKIFRQSFLKMTILSLTARLDRFIRKAYYGGATDHYYLKSNEFEKVFWYDVNSLYPFAMCNEMPFKPLEFINDLSKINIKDFFGFAFVKVECPKSIKIPLLPYKAETGEMIFPTGTWYGTYFSEELKAVIKHGYKISWFKGQPFSKEYLFNNYVNFFFKIKQTAKTTVTRFIAKMHLNQLYGYFGRSRELILTKAVFNRDINLLLGTHFVKSIIQITKKMSIVLMTANLNFDLIKKLKLDLDLTTLKNMRLQKNI